MNYYQLLLGLHILGAGIIALYGGYVLWHIIKRTQMVYQNKAIRLAWLTLAESLSGSLLTFMRPDKQSLLEFCTKIGSYILLIGIIEFILYLKMNRGEGKITVSHVKWAFALSITSIMITVTLLL